MRIAYLLLLIGALAWPAMRGFAQNESSSTPGADPGEKVQEYGAKAFRPGALWRDNKDVHINAHGGGILPMDGVYYWYGEHKIAGRRGNSAQVGVHVYSSRGLLSWKDEGVCFKVSEDPASEVVRGSIIERPKVIFNKKTGKFVMWFHLELFGQGYKAARVGVAVAAAPQGPFEYRGSFRLNAGVWPKNVSEDVRKALLGDSGPEARAAVLKRDPSLADFYKDFKVGQMARDMTLFVDDDGAAYHIAASEENRTLHITRLTDDYLKPSDEYVRVMPGRMNEAPSIGKFGGRYFMITSGCTGWAPNPARLMLADSIWGPWKELPNPWQGPEEMRKTSFDTQSTFILPAPGKPGAFIFMADRWRPRNPIDGRYVWLPVAWKDGVPQLAWLDEWSMDIFDREGYRAPSAR